MDKKGGEYHDFPLKKFCLTVPKIFVVDPLTVSLISATGKISCFKGLCRLTVEIFLSHSAKKNSGGPFCAVSQKNSGSEKVFLKEGGVVKRYSVEKFCLTVPKKVVGELLVSHQFRVSNDFMLHSDESRISVEVCLSHSAE